MTEYYGHKKQRDFICVDEDPEYISGSGANKNGGLLYVVEGVCGSLPCGPYVAGRELTCAVCTKWQEGGTPSKVADNDLPQKNEEWFNKLSWFALRVNRNYEKQHFELI